MRGKPAEFFGARPKKLVEGLTVAQVEEKIGGIKCGFKNTSCGDQLAKACREAYEAQK